MQTFSVFNGNNLPFSTFFHTEREALQVGVGRPKINMEHGTLFAASL